jgi:hypothetical protein
MTKSTESLETAILSDIKKTGFPTEIVCSGVIQQDGWGVTHNPSYLDDIESRSREYDIRAFKSWPVNSLESIDRALGVFLLIECKKSEKPWVFFTTDSSDDLLYPTRIFHSTTDWLFPTDNNQFRRLPDELLRGCHHYFHSKRFARTFYEPFKNQDGSAQLIYSAVMSAIKATLFHEQGEKKQRWATIYYPIIIFNGNLFEAIVSSINKIELISTQHIQLSFNYILPSSPSTSIWQNQKVFLVDVVHEDYLSSFLQTIDEEHLFLSKYLEDSFAKTTTIRPG